MHIGIKKIKQLIKTLSLEKEQLQAFISQEGLEKASVFVASIFENGEKNQINHVMKILKEMLPEFQKIVLSEIIQRTSVFFYYKKILKENLQNIYSILNSDVINAFESSQAEYDALTRCLEDKSFSIDKFEQFAKLSPALIELYLKYYARSNVTKLEWLVSFYGGYKNFDEAFITVLREYASRDSIELIAKMLDKKLEKDKLKELKKMKYAIERGLRNEDRNAKAQSANQPQLVSKPLKAWIGPYVHRRNLRIELLNYLTLTDNYVFCSLSIVNKKIMFSEVAMLEDEKELQNLLKFMNEQAQRISVESDTSYAMYLLEKSIRYHRKKSIVLPEQIEKYLPILLAPYDKKMKNPFAGIYSYEEFVNYPFYNEYIGKLYEEEAMFTTWVMPQKILASFEEEINALRRGIIEIPKEQMNERTREILQKYIEQYWTDSKRKEFAFKLQHMSYYLYKKGKEFLSRLCYAASLKMRQKEIKPFQNAFTELIFAFSFNLYLAYQEQSKKKKQIMTPGEDDKGIILPGQMKRKINQE